MTDFGDLLGSELESIKTLIRKESARLGRTVTAEEVIDEWLSVYEDSIIDAHKQV